MDDSTRWDFKYSVPQLPAGELVGLTEAEAERTLLGRVAAAKDKPVQPMWELAQFYKRTGKLDRANEQFRRLLERVESLDAKAQIILALGQTAERVNDFDLAVRFYRQALGLEPASEWTWYYIHNNLGYCAIQLGRFAEAETYCRTAIATSAMPHNAFKNLGLALSGQGRYQEAAQALVQATRKNAADPRALNHLEALLEEHPELQFDFQADLECGRKAVAVAGQELERIEAKLRGAVPKGQRQS